MCLAVPGRVQEIYESHGLRTGKVNFGGVVKQVCLAYVPEVEVGDYTIVHVGVAISKVDEESAKETLRLLREAGLLAEELSLGVVPTTEINSHCDDRAQANGDGS
jgi:hydrogenase expression/formation protein HypC